MTLDSGRVTDPQPPATSPFAGCTNSSHNERLVLPNVPALGLVSPSTCDHLVGARAWFLYDYEVVCAGCGEIFDLIDWLQSDNHAPAVIPIDAIEEPEGPSAHLQGEA